MTVNTDIKYDFDRYPFTPILPEEAKTIDGRDPRELDLSDEEILDLGIRVLDDPFFKQYLDERFKRMINDTDAGKQRHALYRARGLQRKAQQQLEVKQAAKPPAQPKQTREVTPVTDATKARANQLLDSKAGNALPDRLRMMLARPDENLVQEAIEVATDILQMRSDHRAEIKRIQSDRQVEIEALVAEHQGEIDDLVRQITVLQEQIPEWVIGAQRRWVRLKDKARRMVAAAREDEPTMELPGHGGDPTPHLTVVERDESLAS